MTKKIFGFDKPEDSPGFLLWQTTITWQRLIKKVLDPYEISHAQFVVMAVTMWFESNNQDVTQVMIIKMTKLDKMTVSKALKKLASAGLVKRVEDKLDTRAKAVYLTSKGKELISRLVPIVESVDRDFFGVMKKSEQRFLMGLLNNMICD